MSKANLRLVLEQEVEEEDGGGEEEENWSFNERVTGKEKGQVNIEQHKCRRKVGGYLVGWGV